MKRLTAAATAALLATPFPATQALAHHPMGGAPMETLAQGLLSGMGHPVLGFDHLFFVAAVGIVAAFTGGRMVAPLGYVAGMIAGCALIVAGVALPAVELVIALSLVVAGVVLMRGRALGLHAAVALFGALGLFHGWALGETIVGQEGGMAAPVVAGYLIGLAVTQWTIAVAAGWAVSRLARSAEALQPRLAGGLVAGAGALLVLERAEGAAFAALGIG
jgi:urease accessory protein